ncbi:MAG: PUA domain-containing protein [Candidatus Lokiarchaeia archaeon]|nr:PUA domain-containing protein [Candidatus Lokiarchaeia archaeon]
METDLLLGLRQIQGISDYQFGEEITDILFDDIDQISFERSSKTNKIRYVFYQNHLLLILRPTNGFFTLSFFSAKKIIENTLVPKLRVVVLNEISEFIKKGRNVFCKHVVDIDNTLRPLDEVIVVNQDDELLGIGKLKVPVPYIKDFSVGIAINIRKGSYKSKI